jgi:prepilin-type processing-associated H-X9-DG protein
MRSSLLIVVTVSLFIAIAVRIPPSNETKQAPLKEQSASVETTGEESTMDLAASDHSGERPSQWESIVPEQELGLPTLKPNVPLADLSLSDPGFNSPVITPEQLHQSNTEGFRRAEGFGRHRGGTHVLMGDGAVRFITDSIEAGDHSRSEKSQYGLWGRLGTRANSGLHPSFQNLSHEHYTESVAESFNLDLIQLVSIDRYEQPVAYIDDGLPSMQAIKERSLQTRLLDEFELSAVAKLRAGEQLVISRQLKEMKMVGAIRATQQCVDCHDAPQGELLGAFTYHLSIAGTISDEF